MKWLTSNFKKNAFEIPYIFRGFSKEALWHCQIGSLRMPKRLFGTVKWALWLAQIATVVTLCGCGRSEEEKIQISREQRKKLAAEERATLKIAVSPTIDCLPLFVAKEKGMYEQAGMDIRLKYFTAHMDCDTAIAGGSVEGVVSDLVRLEELKLKMKVELDYLSSTAAEWQLISNRKSRIKRMEQLSDKMVAMTRFSATDALTSKSLEGVKTKSQVYRIQVNDVFVRQNMLNNNEVEAAWFQEPLATAVLQKGGHKLTDSKQLKQAFGVIAFRSEAVKDKQRKPQLDAFVKVYNMACDSINKRGLPFYADIMAKYYHVDKQTVQAIPAIRFTYIGKPKTEDVDNAKAILTKLKKQ